RERQFAAGCQLLAQQPPEGFRGVHRRSVRGDNQIARLEASLGERLAVRCRFDADTALSRLKSYADAGRVEELDEPQRIRLVLLDLPLSVADGLGQIGLAGGNDPAIPPAVFTADVAPRDDQTVRGSQSRREVPVADDDRMSRLPEFDGAAGEDDSAFDIVLAADGTSGDEQVVYVGIHRLDLLSANDETPRAQSAIGYDTAAELDLGAGLRHVLVVVPGGQVVPAFGDSRAAELFFPQVHQPLGQRGHHLPGGVLVGPRRPAHEALRRLIHLAVVRQALP